MRTLSQSILFHVGLLLLSSDLNAKSAQPTICDPATIEIAARNAKLLMENQEKLAPIARSYPLERPTAIFAISLDDEIALRAQKIVEYIAANIGNDLIYGKTGNSNVLLVLPANKFQLASNELRLKITNVIYSVMKEKNQSPYRDRIEALVTQSVEQAKTETDKGEIFYNVVIKINNVIEFIIYFSVGRQNDISQPSIDNKAISNLVLLGLGISPFPQFEHSISSKTDPTYGTAITPEDITLIKILFLSPNLARWREGVDNMRTWCASEK